MSLAVKIRDLEPRHGWYSRSALYRISPTLEVATQDVEYVVVAYTPRAADHGRAETTVFAADRNGNCKVYGGLDGGAERLAASLRVVGRCDHRLALHRLGRYRIVDRPTWTAAKGPAKAATHAFYSGRRGCDRKHVAYLVRNVWGAFVQ